jgi:hypothetical protein
MRRRVLQIKAVGKRIWYLLVAAAHDGIEVVDAVNEEAFLVLQLLLLLLRLCRL